MMTDGNDEKTRREEGDDALWRLLERAGQPRPVSPYFARRVLREVALLDGAQPAAGGSPNWLALGWQALRRSPSVAFACVLVAAALVAAVGWGLATTHRHPPEAVSLQEPAPSATTGGEKTALPEAAMDMDPGAQPTVALLSDPVVTAQDVEVIADLDNLLSREESRLWTEEDTARF